MGLLLLLGFGGTSALSYFSARGTLNRQLANSTLPLTAKAISADLERSLTRPVLVSSSMARNTFLLRWLADGEREQDEMVAYLRDLRSQFRATTAFFVSDRSGRYYHPDGVLKTVSPSDPGDRWYYRLRGMATPFEVNIDRDTANPDRVTAFSNFRVLDRQGRFIGAIGLGIDVRELARELTSHQQLHGAQVLLVARDGRVLLAPGGAAAPDPSVRLQELPGLAPHAARLLREPQVSLRFRHGQGQLFVSSRQIPELGWTMVVLQQTDPRQDALLPILGQNLLIALLVSGVVLLLANATVGSYQRRLQRLAVTDKLTCLLNRTAFDPPVCRSCAAGDPAAAAAGAAVARHRLLQGHQRHPRPSDRRPGDPACGRPAGAHRPSGRTPVSLGWRGIPDPDAGLQRGAGGGAG